MNIKNETIERCLVGQSTAMKTVHRLVQQVAATNASVLILGETGTGKEVVAQCLHSISNRAHKPFIPLNCGAIPAELLESELFGHEKGAFTGAIASRKGRFEMAHGGTLFLDEIGDMPLPMQVKLLRVLQEQSFERIGSGSPVKVDVRIIAATHKNLEEAIQEGQFREDLFYRLNVFPIEVPSLKERITDLPLLIAELNQKRITQGHIAVKLNSSAMKALTHYSWPGNVRELVNFVERMSILFPNRTIGVVDIPERFKKNQHPLFVGKAKKHEQQVLNDLFQEEMRFNKPINLKKQLEVIEINYIYQALDVYEWNVSQAAEFLSIQRTTLVEKMRRYGIKRTDQHSKPVNTSQKSVKA